MSRTAAVTAVGAALPGGTPLSRYFARRRASAAEKRPGSAPAQAAPDTAKLTSFFWRQTSENADACFVFSLGKAQGDGKAEGHYLNCTFRTPDGETAEYGDVPVTEEQWRRLEGALRGLLLPPYQPPDPDILDASDSCVEICRTGTGGRLADRYDGEHAHELYAFLMTFLGQITG